MIEIQISKDIWENKYRYNAETECDFYKRLVKGIFDLVSDTDISKYYSLISVSSREELYNTIYNMFKDHKAMLAGRALYSLGTNKTNQSLSNCFVIPIESDSMLGIMKALERSAMTMKAGGGVGYNFSILRPKGSLIKTSGASSTGTLSFMRIFNTTCNTIEAGGNRRGAQIGILGMWHPDIEAFITCKQYGSDIPDDLKPYKNFNLSVFIPDDFIDALRKDLNWELIFPDTSYEKYSTEWDGNIRAWKAKGYPVVLYKKVRARDLWDNLMHSTYNFAEPGVLFEDTINKNNTLWMREYIMACNPCGEQPLVPFASCNLGSINLVSYVQDAFLDNASFDIESFKKVVRYMVMVMDRVLDVNYFPLPEQKKVVEDKRQIGIGITGLGDTLAMLCLKYSSEEARSFVEHLMNIFRETAYEANAYLAKNLGPFPEWLTFTEEEKLGFVSGSYLKSLPEKLKSDIKTYGCRCSRLLSIAPTGTMSLLLNNVSGGCEPLFLLEYDRKIKVSSEETITETIESYSWRKYKEKFGHTLVENKPDFFETTEDLNVEDHINMQAVLQKYICTAISKTINVPENYSYDDFKDIYLKAYDKGIKGCTTYRPNNILGSVLSKKSDSNICADEKRPKSIVPNCAPKRPAELPCDIIFTNIKGEAWTVLIGLLDGKPYEVFAGNTTEELYLPKSCKEGIIRKQGQGMYELEVTIRNKSVIYKDLASILMTDGQKATTRLLSLALRHGVPTKYVVEQLKKTNGSIVEFSTAVSRVLSKYVDSFSLDGDKNKCPVCGESSLLFEEGCIKCIAGCGYSRCS